jgi:DNA-binding CsgD family transcriptional regulator
MLSASGLDLVGRAEDIGVLRRFLEAVEELPAAVVLEGDAGIGKTTLLASAIEAAHKRGYRTLACRPGEAEAQLSFAGLRDLLEHEYDAVAAELPPPQRRALAVAMLREEPTGAGPEAGAVAAALLGSVRLLAQAGPVLIAVDDAQWLDRPSATVIEFALRRLREEQVAVLLAGRPDRKGLPLSLDRALPERRTRRRRVGPVGPGTLHGVLQKQLGVHFPSPLLRRIHAASGGNPFFALEIARAIERRGGELAPGEPLPAPEDLHELLQERLSTLPKESTTALLAAAALSQPTLPLVTAARGAYAASRLEYAAEANVVELDGERIRFTHPLLAAAVYSAAGPQKRRNLHRDLADVVTDPEERAHHLALATQRPSAEVAEALDEASRRARSRGAPEGAAELAEQALRLTPSEAEDDALRRRIDAAGHYFEAGDAARARNFLEEALASAPRGLKRAEVLTHLGRVHSFEADLRRAAALYREALSEAGGEAIRAEAESGLALALLRKLEDLPAAVEHARAASKLAEERGDLHLLSEFLTVQALIEGILGDPQAQRTMERAASLGREASDTDLPPSYFLRGLRGAGFTAAVLRTWHDDIDEARAELASAHRRALELGDESALPLILRWASYAEWLAGDWEQALRLADEGYDVAAQTGQPSQQAVLAGTRALVLAHLGRVEEARAAAEECCAVSESTGAGFGTIVGITALGFLELSLENADATHRYLGPFVERLEQSGVQEPGATRFVPHEIEALIALDRLAEAEALLERFEERAAALGRISALAAAKRCRGLLDAARGELQTARSALEEALELHEGAPFPFDRARTLLALGQLQRRAKQRREARETLEATVPLFEELGARIWAERARAELGRIGGRTPSGSDLTPTEHRLAELVAEGRSNKEVAAALFVTPKTVETKLSRIYEKLGVRSRTELARRFADEPASKV